MDFGEKDTDNIQDLHGHLNYMNIKFPSKSGLNFHADRNIGSKVLLMVSKD